jgi:hypothetical protein
MSVAQEAGVDHNPLDKCPEIMRPPWPHSQKMFLRSLLTELNSRRLPFFETKLFCGRHDSTNFVGKVSFEKLAIPTRSMVSATTCHGRNEMDAGCPAVRFHDLRHTNAILRLENAENIKYI